MDSIFKILKKRIKLALFILIPLLGLALIYEGCNSYKEIYDISPLYSTSSGILIATDKNLTISDFILYVDKNYAVEKSEGVMGSFLQMEINSSNSIILITIPHEVKWDRFVNYTEGYVNYTSEYNPYSDETTFIIIYTTSQPTYKFRIIFDWKIEDRESYYQWKVRIPIYTTGVKIPHRKGEWILDTVFIPAIKNYKVEICYPKIYNVDSDLTYPTPDQVFFTEDRIQISWLFGDKYLNNIQYRDISSVQAGFLSVEKMNEKDNKLFWSGIIIGLGIAVILQWLFLVLEKKKLV